MKHKWYKEIQAWSEGAEIEAKEKVFGEWLSISDVQNPYSEAPNWNEKRLEFRIKPQDIFKCQKQACPALKEKKYLYVYNRDGKYELGEEPHPAMHYCPIIGKIEVVNDE